MYLKLILYCVTLSLSDSANVPLLWMLVPSSTWKQSSSCVPWRSAGLECLTDREETQANSIHLAAVFNNTHSNTRFD